jgi:hypothetical protein
MKKHTIILLITLIFIAVTINNYHSAKATTPLKAGVNYIEGYTYNTPENEIRKHMQLFKDNDITLIYIDIRWDILETAQGVYSLNYLSRIKKVIDIANEYEIRVGVAWMTNCRSTGGTIPNWVSPRNYKTVVTTSDVRKAWITTHTYVSEYLSTCTNIDSWIPLDEPGTGGCVSDVPIETLLQLWTDLKNAIGRRFAIRFASNDLDTPQSQGYDYRFWNYMPQIYQLCDFMCINWYRNYPADLESLVANAHANGKTVELGGCGNNPSSESSQASMYQQDWDWFVELKIEATMAWFWSSTSDLSNTWNLCKNSEGTPKQAFYTLTSYNTPSSTQAPSPSSSPSPSPTPTPTLTPAPLPPPLPPSIFTFGGDDPIWSAGKAIIFPSSMLDESNTLYFVLGGVLAAVIVGIVVFSIFYIKHGSSE